MWTKFVTPKSIIAATVTVSLVGVAAIGSIGVQSYTSAQHHAEDEMSYLAGEIDHRVADLTSASGAADELIAKAQETLDGSAGKTLDSTARDELAAVLAEARDELAASQDEAHALADSLQSAEANFEDTMIWPPDAEAIIADLHEEYDSVGDNLDALLEEVSASQQAVQDAQAAWQAEQDRIAAEAAKAAAAAAAARAKAASAGSTLRPSGGSTAPNVQQAPAAAPAETLTTTWAESFLRQYVSPAQASLAWNPNLCQPGYICGTTTVGRGVPIITLMGTAQAPANYNWGGGKYVLVHEAAHARQYWLYGSVAGMISGAERVTASMGITGVAAVEYMADCSTIVKIGYAGTYTASCTPEQLAEAARVW